MHIPIATIVWEPSFRIIASRYPSIDFFERLAADPTEWEILIELESITNPSLNVGDLGMLELVDRIGGHGSGRILPSFTFLDPNPLTSRFSNSQFGAFYAAMDLNTAIAETVHHRTIFMASTSQPPQDIDQLLILADIKGQMHDIRAMQTNLANIYSSADYAASQTLANELRNRGSLGIVYNSVRRPTGKCVAVLRARAVSNAHEDRHITYRWNGRTISGFYDKGGFKTL